MAPERAPLGFPTPPAASGPREALRGALEGALRHAGEAIAWPFGAVWLPIPDALLECAAAWTPEEASRGELSRFTHGVLVERDGDLPGRAFGSTRPEWAGPDDVVRSRRDAARRLGIATRLAVPVMDAGEIVAILELGTRAVVRPAEALVDRLEPAAAQIAAVVRRAQAQEAMRQAEERLVAAQRMETVGRLATGIAHDFNNLLVVILSDCGFVLDALRPGDPARADVEEIRACAERAAALTRQVLAWSRTHRPVPRSVDVNVVVRDMVGLLGRLIGEDVSLAADLASELGRVAVDPSQLEQVILNLAVNARDAMPTGGRLAIETASVEGWSARAGGDPGPGVRLTVTDTGHGMTEAVRARLFEPFFTTKTAGKGTGFGLSTVHAIVAQSGGTIEVESAPGRGASFRITWPRAEACEHASAPAVRGALRGGTETVLVVEDDARVRATVRRTLEPHGYAVLEAATGTEALTVVQRHPGPIHLVLCDVVVPGPGGPELGRQITARRPEARVLFMSGYADHALVREATGAGAPLLQKPFTTEVLVARAREALGG